MAPPAWAGGDGGFGGADGSLNYTGLDWTPGNTTTGEGGGMVFDATGVALGGIVKARFRFVVFRDEDGVVTACAQEKIMSLSFLAPSKETLENEHRHTFKDLNESFRSPSR